MKLQLSLKGIALLCILALAIVAASCEQPQQAGNANTSANTNASAPQPAGLPSDATPFAGAPGFYQAGPTGNVSLKFSAPLDGKNIDGNTVGTTFTITGYPIYQDAARKKGQHIHVILDNEPYEADYNPGVPFSPDKFKTLTPGTHTLRAFPSREWHESIKQPDAADFDFIVFSVGAPTVTNVDKKAPLVTYSRPKGDYKFKDDPRGLMLDFYLTNATLGENDYKVRYTLDGKKPVVLTKWEPVWWSWDDVPVGEHTVVLELLDKSDHPMPFKVGDMDYNHTERKFRITDDAGAADHSHDSNSNSAAANKNK